MNSTRKELLTGAQCMRLALWLVLAAFFASYACGCTRIETSGNVYQASGFSTVVIADAQTSATLTVNANHAPGASWLTAIWAAIAGMFGGSK